MTLYRRLRAFLHPFRVFYMSFREDSRRQKQLRSLNLSGVWLDVGAHFGESTKEIAKANKSLTVFAFEPDPKNAKRLRASPLRNYHVIEKAVSETDGNINFNLNSHDATHSILPLRKEGVAEWHIDTSLKNISQITVASIRLDTFLKEYGLMDVDYLKVDAQGADLSVVRSAGSSLRVIKKIKLEVITAREPLYDGEAKKEDVLAFLDQNGFQLHEETIGEGGLFEDLVFKRR